METNSIIKGVASVVAAESYASSLCDYGPMLGIITLFAAIFIYAFTKLDSDIKSLKSEVKADIKALIDKIDADARANNIRFDLLQQSINARVDQQNASFNAKFDQQNAKFDQQNAISNAKFDEMQKTIMEMLKNQRLKSDP